MRRIQKSNGVNPSNTIKQKFEKIDLGNSIFKYNVIYDALKVICSYYKH